MAGARTVSALLRTVAGRWHHDSLMDTNGHPIRIVVFPFITTKLSTVPAADRSLEGSDAGVI
jgi:hypothetical protein